RHAPSITPPRGHRLARARRLQAPVFSPECPLQATHIRFPQGASRTVSWLNYVTYGLAPGLPLARVPFFREPGGMRMVPKARKTHATLLVLTLLAGGATACTPLNASSAPWPTASSRVVVGEVRSVDTRRNLIQVRDQRGGSVVARYDGRTRVMYGPMRSSIRVLDRGDRVRMHVRYDRRGTPRAERVDVIQDYARRSPVAIGRVQRVSGTVRQVDTRRGYFMLDPGRSGNIRVIVPHRLSRNDARRFDRLRRGDRVRVDIRYYSRNQAELVRFR